MELVEILLSTYNGEQFLDAQIESIMGQSYPFFKLIIRDDGSSDQTLEKIKEWLKKDQRIEFIPSGQRLGVSKSFEVLMEHSISNRLFFCDQDDVWIKDKIERMLDVANEQEQFWGKSCPLLIHTDLTVVDQSLKLIHSSFWNYSGLKPLSYKKFTHSFFQNNVTGCASLINRALLEKALPLAKEAILHDHWLALVAGAFGKKIAMPIPLVLYRQHHHNVVGAKAYNPFKKIFRKRVDLTPFFKQVEGFKSKFELEIACPEAHTIKDSVEAFLKIRQSGFFKKRYLIVRYKFYKQGFLRNLSLLSGF